MKKHYDQKKIVSMETIPGSTVSIWRKFDQLYCINELLANDVLLVSKILLDNEEALWHKKTEDNSCQPNFDNCPILALS